MKDINYKITIQVPSPLKSELVLLYQKSTHKSLSSFIASYIDPFVDIHPSLFDKLTFYYSRFFPHPNADFSFMYPNLNDTFTFENHPPVTLTVYLDNHQRQRVDVLCYSKFRSYRDIISLLVLYICRFSPVPTVKPVHSL